MSRPEWTKKYAPRDGEEFIQGNFSQFEMRALELYSKLWEEAGVPVIMTHDEACVPEEHVQSLREFYLRELDRYIKMPVIPLPTTAEPKWLSLPWTPGGEARAIDRIAQRGGTGGLEQARDDRGGSSAD